MKRVALLIDGGYFRSIASRRGFSSKNALFIEECAQRCIEEEEELYRILYYDCAGYSGTKNLPVSGDEATISISGEWIEDLAIRQYFAVRTGTYQFRGWKLKKFRTLPNRPLEDFDFKPDLQQKGVDMQIGVDITLLSLTPIVDRLILVMGDTDLIPAIKLGRKRGLQIVIVKFDGVRIHHELKKHVDIIRPVQWPTVPMKQPSDYDEEEHADYDEVHDEHVHECVSKTAARKVSISVGDHYVGKVKKIEFKNGVQFGFIAVDGVSDFYFGVNETDLAVPSEARYLVEGVTVELKVKHYKPDPSNPRKVPAAHHVRIVRT